MVDAANPMHAAVDGVVAMASQVPAAAVAVADTANPALNMVAHSVDPEAHLMVPNVVVRSVDPEAHLTVPNVVARSVDLAVLLVAPNVVVVHSADLAVLLAEYVVVRHITNNLLKAASAAFFVVGRIYLRISFEENV